MKITRSRGDGLTPFVFDPQQLARLYRHIPPQVIADLAILCFADAPTFDPDPRIDARNSGRRDVWLHVNNYLRLDPEQIEDIYRGRGHVVVTEEEYLDG